MKNGAGEWTEVKREKKQHQLLQMIVGTSSSGSTKVKAATAPQSKPKSWHVFVGRLDSPSTTANDIQGYLEDASFLDNDVCPLEKKEKWKERYAAFRVAINV